MVPRDGSLFDVHDLPNRDGNSRGRGSKRSEGGFMTFLTGMETFDSASRSSCLSAVHDLPNRDGNKEAKAAKIRVDEVHDLPNRDGNR